MTQHNITADLLRLRSATKPRARAEKSVLERLRTPQAEDMNGYIIEVSASAPGKGRRRLSRWIGVAVSAAEMIALLPGHSPSVVDRGPEVLERALSLGLKRGEVRRQHR